MKINEMETIEDVVKLQDALLVLHQIDGPIELVHMIKQRIAEINEED